MIPLVRVLSRAHQGVWGIVLSGQDKQPLVGAEININGRVVKTDEKGEYLAVMPVGPPFWMLLRVCAWTHAKPSGNFWKSCRLMPL